eukprot:COSAG02_NODE_5927_length_3937_cov_2.933299_2_plen_158_part_00
MRYLTWLSKAWRLNERGKGSCRARTGGGAAGGGGAGAGRGGAGGGGQGRGLQRGGRGGGRRRRGRGRGGPHAPSLQPGCREFFRCKRWRSPSEALINWCAHATRIDPPAFPLVKVLAMWAGRADPHGNATRPFDAPHPADCPLALGQPTSTTHKRRS